MQALGKQIGKVMLSENSEKWASCVELHDGSSGTSHFHWGGAQGNNYSSYILSFRSVSLPEWWSIARLLTGLAGLTTKRRTETIRYNSLIFGADVNSCLHLGPKVDSVSLEEAITPLMGLNSTLISLLNGLQGS